MEPKYKTLIPLIVIFFIIGVVVGYVAHMPATIEIEKPVEKIIYQNNTVYVTVTPTPAPVTATAAPTATPAISDFTVRNYNPSTDFPTATIQLTSKGADPSSVSIHQGNTVLIQVSYYYSSLSPLILYLNVTPVPEILEYAAYSQNLGTSGAVVVTFNKKGSYSLKAVISPGDPNVIPRTYAEGTVVVY